MKPRPAHIFAVASILAVASAVGYALLENPAPSPAAALSLPAAPEIAPSGEPKLQASYSITGKQAPRETQGSVTGEHSPAIQPATPAVQPATASAQAAPASGGAEALRPPARVPLAFRPLPPEFAAANPHIVAALQAVQQNFVNAVAGPNQNSNPNSNQVPNQNPKPAANQDPNDPAYYQRWSVAQRNADEQYRLLVGTQAFLTQQMSHGTAQ